MKRPPRYRAGVHRPAAPRGDRIQRSDRIPAGENVFHWRVGEVVEGVRKPPIGSMSVMDRVALLCGPTPPEGEAE